MRKSLVVLGLVAVTLLASATDVFAQRGRGGYRGTGAYIGTGGYYNSSPYYYGNRGYYSGYRYPYSSGYYYTTPYYYSTPTYYTDPVVVVPTESRQSFYSDPNVANITILVPVSSAEVWVENAPTTQRGMERTFHSPPLEPGNYTYTIRARWTENGRTMDQTRQIRVQAGQSVTVDFRNSAENLPAPRSPD